MKKILICVLTSTALTGSAFAESSAAFKGAYIGAGLTYSQGKLNKVNVANQLANFTSRGFGVNGFLGYGSIILSGLYLGGEFSFGLDGSRFRNKLYNNNGVSARLSSNSKLTYNVAARVGYVISNLLPYIKAGYEGRSKVKLLNGSGGTVLSVSRSGFLLGAGADYALTNNVFVRGEYNYNFGSRKKTSVGSSNFTMRTPTHTFLIGAGYRF